MSTGIKPYYNAALWATHDRIDVTKMSKRQNLSKFEKNYLDLIKEESGPSVHNPIKVVKNWIKAYQQNLIKQKTIVAINAPFKHPSFIKKFLKF